MAPDLHAGVHDWKLRKEWRDYVRRVLRDDTAARRQYWASRPRRELLDEAKRVLPWTPRDEFNEWGSTRLASVLVNGQLARTLELVNQGLLGKAALELERLMDRSRAPDQGAR